MPRAIHHNSLLRASGTSGFKVSADTMQVLFTWMDTLGHWYSLFSAFSLLDMFFGVLVVACLCYIACHLLSIVREVFLCVFRLYKKKTAMPEDKPIMHMERRKKKRFSTQHLKLIPQSSGECAVACEAVRGG
uniref:Uncharacterized protein n=1 Tax=Noctiluca scintillans TaxID=2966 RepID=A0A7S1A785_NOCSC